MQASLAGSSHLQFVGPARGDSDQSKDHRVFSPVPSQNLGPGGVSPFQYARPDTNIVYPQDTILELPDREQNPDNTNDYSEYEMKQNALIL